MHRAHLVTLNDEHKVKRSIKRSIDSACSSKIVSVSAAKKMMSLVSGRGDAASAASSSSSSSLSLRTKKNKRKLYRPEISSPMDMPSHPVSVIIHKLITPTQADTIVQSTCQQSMENRLILMYAFTLNATDLYFHEFWLCPPVHHSWKEITTKLSLFFGYSLPLSPSLCI